MAATVIAVYSTKGGVGKTTAAVNLAWQAASEGLGVLLWDLEAAGEVAWAPAGEAAFARRCRGARAREEACAQSGA